MSHDSTITFNTPRMKVTDYVAHFLAERGVTAVFELSGGMITHTCWILRADMEKPGSCVLIMEPLAKAVDMEST